MICLFIPYNLFFLSPTLVYLSNEGEFSSGLGEILRLCITLALVATLGLFAILKYLPYVAQKSILVIFSSVSILVWAQDNILAWDYGVFDGRNIEWTLSHWQAFIDTPLWVGFILLTLYYKDKLFNKLWVIAAALLFIQTVSALVLVTQNYDDLLTKDSFSDSGSLQQVFRFSERENVLHIVLDGFQADVFDELINNEQLGSYYQNAFRGFTFYRENLGVFPYTRFAVPAFLGEKIYNIEEPKDAFIDSVLSGDNILNAAVAAGYELDVASGSHYFTERYANASYTNIYGLDNLTVIDPAIKDTAKLIETSLFKAAPRLLKPIIYNEQKWRITSLLSGNPGAEQLYFIHTSFLYGLINSLTADRKNPVYKYIHVMNTHNPMVTNTNCNFSGNLAGSGRASLTIQSKCTLDTLAILFDTLDEEGLYDDMFIIMHGDHGGWVPNLRQGPNIVLTNGAVLPKAASSLASPLLAIKLPESNKPFSISDQQTSLLQIPSTIARTMDWKHNFTYNPISDENSSQAIKRHFYFYDWQRDAWETDYTGPIQIFEIDGSHYETKWNPVGQYLPPGKP